MKEINIGRVLIKNRHKRGITQDELANHLGVSKRDLHYQIFCYCHN